MFVISYDNTSIYYEIHGNGNPLLLLHGFSNDHTIWNDTGLIDKLKNDFTVISMDFRGCGLSEKPLNSESYSIKAHIEDIKAVLNACTTKTIVLWGWSFGATIALYYSKYYRTNATIAAGTYFGPIFTEDYINKRLNETTDEIIKERLHGLRQWEPINPNEIVSPFLLYTGTNDGNVVVQIRKQKDEIIKSGGNVEIIKDLDHYGLLNDEATIDNYVIPFIRRHSRKKRHITPASTL